MPARLKIGQLAPILALSVLGACALAAGVCASDDGELPTAMVPRVIAKWPHDPTAFTQGLLYERDHLLESTGLRGQSSLRRTKLESGTIAQKVDLHADLFAEGLARVDGSLVQLTWTSGKALVWNAKTLELEEQWTYEGEGWGLCFDGKRLVMSDGTSWLTFRSPKDFSVQGEVRVRRDGGAVRRLNELECVGELVYANVWQTDTIVVIQPESGEVVSTIDAGGLLSDKERAEADVLNGIAWSADRDAFLLTGKRWPWVFEVQFVPSSP